MDTARTFVSTDSIAPHASAKRLPYASAEASAPQPFWGRLTRALGVLLIASATHVWLLRAPQSTDGLRPTRQAIPSASAAVAAPLAQTDSPPPVSVVTELVPLGTSGVLRPSPVEPDLIPTPTATIEAKRLDQGDTPASGVSEAIAAAAKTASPSGAASTARPPDQSAAPAAAPLPLTPSLSSAPRFEGSARRLAAAAVMTRPLPPVTRPAALADADQQQLVRRLLQEYVAAFERLDADAAKAVWPTVNDKALRRAFDQLEAQHLTFQSCGITIEGSGANARCQGQATYRPRIGSRVLRISPREWTFNLAKANDGWQIVDARVR